ncbi:hypothetical protein [Amycolatopsis minnesotensis]|uniref:hypothetical protein n=1 Tax=Amycolatopsis minnesotensis TaxID=337894 RepID=UPI0031D0F81E
MDELRTACGMELRRHPSKPFADGVCSGGSTHLGSTVTATADIVRWFTGRFPPG